MKKLIMAVAFAFAAVPLFGFVAPVFADSPGQLASGPDLYQVRNVTQNGSYSSTVSAKCNEVVKYSVKLANSEFGLLENVTVRASLTNGSMTATATNAASQTTSVSGSVTVNVTGGSLVYVNGSTKNFDVNGNLIKVLPDGVTAGGVNKGTLKGSTREFVQFEAKVQCDQPPKPVIIEVCELSTKKIIKIDEKNFDATKHSKNLADCSKPPKPPVTIEVCELATKKIIKIDEKAFDSNKHSKNLADCADKPQPGNITVCELATKKVINIKETDFDAAKHTKDLSKCAETPEVPEELPNTGAGSLLGLFVGASLLGSIGYRVWAARRVQ